MLIDFGVISCILNHHKFVVICVDLESNFGGAKIDVGKCNLIVSGQSYNISGYKYWLDKNSIDIILDSEGLDIEKGDQAYLEPH